MTENAASEPIETPRSSLKEELAAMDTIGTALEALDDSAKLRVFEFIAKRFCLSSTSAAGRATDSTARASKGSNGNKSAVSTAASDDEEGGPGSFSDIGAVYDAAGPSTDTERALVAAYWFQVEQQQPDWGSQQVNDALKNLGHGISNITRALGELISRKPNLVRQLQKSGSSKQARKTYRLTDAGIRRVREMLNGSAAEE